MHTANKNLKLVKKKLLHSKAVCRAPTIKFNIIHVVFFKKKMLKNAFKKRISQKNISLENNNYIFVNKIQRQNLKYFYQILNGFKGSGL